MMLLDVGARGLSGKAAEKALDVVGLTVNKNTIPFDSRPPMVASGIRIGTPAVTTRGMTPAEMEIIAGAIARALEAPEDDAVRSEVRRTVRELCEGFPLIA
jgi:glycine hydroxymethyltransferase